MSGQYPALIVTVPLLAGLLVFIAGWVDKRWCFPIAVAALGIAVVVPILSNVIPILPNSRDGDNL